MVHEAVATERVAFLDLLSLWEHLILVVLIAELSVKGLALLGRVCEIDVPLAPPQNRFGTVLRARMRG